MSSKLRNLLDIITTSVDGITNVCERRGQEFPDLDKPAALSESTSDGIRNDPQVMDAITLCVAAAAQLIATLQPPSVTLSTSSMRYNLSATLSAAERTHVAEILRGADSKGMHVTEIAAQNGMNSEKLARILRYLATNHIFKEVAPDVFAHNLISSLLDTGKSLDVIKKSPVTKFEKTNGLAAFAEFCTDDCMKAGAYLSETLIDPATAHSEEPNEASFQRAFSIDKHFWLFIKDHEYRRSRFSVAMTGTAPSAAILTAFDWTSVPLGGVLVDVGCGLGNVSLEVAKARPDIKIVLQDRSHVIEKAKEYWKALPPGQFTPENIHFIGHDFFGAQPALPGKPDVFLLRAITHDWSDKYARKILKNLRDAAGPDTRLLIIDNITEYPCGKPDSDSRLAVPGFEHVDPPAPLLANLGFANVMAYDIDIVMMSMLNSSERTIRGFVDLLSASGWKLTEVRKNAGRKMLWPSIIAVPA